MIESFSHKGIEDLFYDGSKRGVSPKDAPKLIRILERLDSASDIKDMNYPGAGLHKLEPKSKNRWAVSVTGNWRITFRFENGNASEVNYEDYH